MRSITKIKLINQEKNKQRNNTSDGKDDEEVKKCKR